MRRTGVALLPLLFTATMALAHGDRSGGVRPEVDVLPEVMRGMRVEIHKTIGIQLVIENPTAHRLEALDAAGQPFLRIGPEGVEGNFAAPAWYLTYSPGFMPPKLESGAGPRWVKVSNEPSFGWFEPRLDATSIEVPHTIRHNGRTETVGRWQVPLRVDDSIVLLAGSFRYHPPPAGVYVAKLLSPPEIAPGVRVKLLPGQVPGMLLQSSSPLPLVVFGIRGEPFLRIGPAGVEANLQSPTWRRSGRLNQGSTAPASSKPEWIRVASVARFSWVEPRASYAQNNQATSWTVPMLLGDQELAVSGNLVWKPLPLRG